MNGPRNGLCRRAAEARTENVPGKLIHYFTKLWKVGSIPIAPSHDLDLRMKTTLAVLFLYQTIRGWSPDDHKGVGTNPVRRVDNFRLVGNSVPLRHKELT